MHKERKKWIRSRFGHVDDSILGWVKDMVEINWVNVITDYEVNGRILTYRMVDDIESSAERIAEIYRNGADEMIHNREIQWHQDPDEIVRRVGTGDWSFYGCYLEKVMIAVESMHIIRGDSVMEWVWGCVDPVYRGMGVWQHIGVYTDMIVERSGAQVGSVWVVTTHEYSQMSVERAGYVPMGCFIGKRVYGGSDHRYYRSTLIHYAKIYGKAKRHLQNWESMHLTEKAAKVVNAVREIWKKAEVSAGKR